MAYKFGYTIPMNITIFKSNFDYYHGIGKFSKDECIDRSLLISGVRLVDQEDYIDYIADNDLQDIFKK
jgi:hypothetical protein